jgi:hypothetical protein
MLGPPFEQSQAASNHHANAEMIDKAGVLVVERIRAPEIFAESGRTFHLAPDGVVGRISDA